MERPNGSGILAAKCCYVESGRGSLWRCERLVSDPVHRRGGDHAFVAPAVLRCIHCRRIRAGGSCDCEVAMLTLARAKLGGTLSTGDARDLSKRAGGYRDGWRAAMAAAGAALDEKARDRAKAYGGGDTSARELRHAADVLRSMAVPSIEVIGE